MKIKQTGWRWDCERDGCWMKKCKLDFSHFDNIFPRGIKFTDADGWVEWCGRFLIQEWKHPGTELPTGQRIALERFTEIPYNAALVVNGDVETMTPVSISKVWKGKVFPAQEADMRHLIESIEKWRDLVAKKFS